MFAWLRARNRDFRYDVIAFSLNPRANLLARNMQTRTAFTRDIDPPHKLFSDSCM